MESPDVRSINRNIRKIKELNISSAQSVEDETLEKLKDVIIFYGLTPDIYLEIIKEGKVPYSYPADKLDDLEQIINAHLFRIKYRIDEDLNNIEKEL